jgi:hypothetical protein
MRLAAQALSIVLSLMAGSSAMAQACSESYVADCGDFKIVNTACVNYDSKGRVAGESESMGVLFNDPRVGKVSMSLEVTNDVAIYSAPIAPGVTQYVNFASRILTDIKHKPVYTAHRVENGVKSEEVACKLLPFEYVE